MTKLLKAMFGSVIEAEAFTKGLLDGIASSRYVMTPGIAQLRVAKRSNVPSDVRAQRRVARHMASTLKTLVDHD